MASDEIRVEIERLLSGEAALRMPIVDLRSDTVTWPPAGMRAAMACAAVGDDVFGEDPTVGALEARMAALFGTEAAVLLSSGTQGNLVGVLSHCARGDEAILGARSHVVLYEAGGIAALGGVMPRTVPVQADGTLRLDDLRAAVRPLGDVHYPVSRLIVLENSQASLDGAPLRSDYVAQVVRLAREHNLAVHVDGARVLHAAAALGEDVAALCRGVDTVSVCLSKGLCAPLGAVLVGTSAAIARARRLRKMLGGGTRQAGVVAAAGLWALDHVLPSLADDVRRAAELAAFLRTLPWAVNVAAHTNLVFFDIDPASGVSHDALVRVAAEHRVLILGRDRVRLAVHYWVDDAALAVVRTALAAVAATAQS